MQYVKFIMGSLIHLGITLDGTISVMNYVILTYSPSLQSFNLAVLLYVNFYINKVK